MAEVAPVLHRHENSASEKGTGEVPMIEFFVLLVVFALIMAVFIAVFGAAMAIVIWILELPSKLLRLLR
jgi:hypothetical protein